MAPARKPGLFLDRDGVIIEERHYLSGIDGLALIPGAAAALRRAAGHGFRIVVVTNQSAVARGLISEAELERIHDHLRAVLAAEGAHIDALYYCPHHPEVGTAPYRTQCCCRKPQPGMLLAAIGDLGLDPAASVMVGDALRDIAAARRAGLARALLVRTGAGTEAEAGIAAATAEQRPDAVFDDLGAAVADAIAHGGGVV